MKLYIKRFISISIVATLLICLAFANVSAISVDPENKYKYDEIITPKVFKEWQLQDPDFVINYSERYEYYSSDDISTQDELVPDFVLISLDTNWCIDTFAGDIFGDYVLTTTSAGIPFTYGYGIYVPKTGEVYDLYNAYKIGIEGIENVFTKGGVGRLLGDMDRDRKLTVKDATYIQKILAGVEGFTEPTIHAAEFDNTLPISISDFNRDRVRNIKDATAIQKYIAGLSY